MGVPLAEKTKLEVFGKGSGKEPFFRKVFPSDRYKLLYEYRLYPLAAFAHVIQNFAMSITSKPSIEADTNASDESAYTYPPI